MMNMPTAREREPLLSIVTVCRNAASTIGGTLDSVDRCFSSDADDVEHLVLDGRSTDATLAIIEAHASSMRRHLSEADSGMYDAMNKGLRMARGEYVWFLNADDRLHADFMHTRSALMTALRDRRPAVLVGEIQMFRFSSGALRRTRYWQAPRRLARAARWGWHPPHPAFVARRASLIDLGGFDLSKSVAADFKLMTQAIRQAGLENVSIFPHPLVAMQEGGASNRSVRAIFLANGQCYSSLREVGFSRWSAGLQICMKLTRKIGQRLSRTPARGLNPLGGAAAEDLSLDKVAAAPGRVHG